ncbi:YjbQ family protein [Marinifilum sp.]|uniref:YjbQ family protein n=1 Tax=Marinifilum sp. TaxID=2033137 RepID=UPI003BA98BDB
MQKQIIIRTDKHNALYDIILQLEKTLAESCIQSGVVNGYAQVATAAIMIQENWKDSEQNDVVKLLKKRTPSRVWEHDTRVVMAIRI